MKKVLQLLACAALLGGCARTQDYSAADFSRAAIAAGDAHLRLRESGPAQKWINAVPPAERKWEWRYLHAIADAAEKSATLSEKPLYCMDLSADGALLVAAGEAGEATILPTDTFVKTRTVEGPEPAEINGCAWHPDSRHFATVGADPKIHLWDSRDRRLVRAFEGMRNNVSSVAFSPDGSVVAAASWDWNEARQVVGVVRLWDAQTGEQIGTLPDTGQKPLMSVRFSPDGSLLAAGSWDYEVIVWQVEDRAVHRRLLVPDRGLYRPVDCLAFSPDGKSIAAGTRDKWVQMWKLDSEEIIHARHLEAQPMGLAFSPDGKWLAIAGGNGIVSVVDPSEKADTRPDLRRIVELSGHSATTRAVRWSTDGNVLFSAASDGTVRKWNIAAQKKRALPLSSGLANGSLWFDNSGKMHLADFSGNVVRWDADKSVAEKAFAADAGAGLMTIPVPGTPLLASASHDRVAYLLDAESGRTVHRWELEAGGRCVAAAPDGTLVVFSEGNGLRAFTPRDPWPVHWRQKDVFEGTERAEWMAHANYRLFAVGSAGTFVAMDARTGSVHRRIPAHGRSGNRVLAHPDGSTVATAGSDGVVALWTADDAPRPLWRTELGTGQFALLFSEDGARLFAGGQLGTVTILDARTGAVQLAIRALPETIWQLATMPGTETLLATDLGGGMKFLETKP